MCGVLCMRTEPASFAQTGIGAVHPGLGFAPCWGELLFLGQKANVVRRRRRKSPAPTMAPNSLRESGTHRIEFASLRQKTGAAQLASQARLRQVLALIRFWPARGGARKVADKAEPVRSTSSSSPLRREPLRNNRTADKSLPRRVPASKGRNQCRGVLH